MSYLVLPDCFHYFSDDLLFPMLKLPGFLHESGVAAPTIICLCELLTYRKHLFIQLYQQTLNSDDEPVFGTLVDLLTRIASNLLLQQVETVDILGQLSLDLIKFNESIARLRGIDMVLKDLSNGWRHSPSLIPTTSLSLRFQFTTLNCCSTSRGAAI